MNRYAIFRLLLALFMSWSAVPGTAQAQNPAEVGQWSLGPFWDIAPINTMVLPSGKVMFHSREYGNWGRCSRVGPGCEYDHKSGQSRL